MNQFHQFYSDKMYTSDRIIFKQQKSCAKVDFFLFFFCFSTYGQIWFYGFPAVYCIMSSRVLSHYQTVVLVTSVPVSWEEHHRFSCFSLYWNHILRLCVISNSKLSRGNKPIMTATVTVDRILKAKEEKKKMLQLLERLI